MRSGPPISPLQADRPLRAPPREGALGRQGAVGSILPAPRMSRLACLIARVSFAMFLRATAVRIHLHTREPVQGLLRYSHFTDKKIFLGESPPGQDPRKAWQKKMRGLGRSFWASCSSPARGCSAPFLGLRRRDAGAQAPTSPHPGPLAVPKDCSKGPSSPRGPCMPLCFGVWEQAWSLRRALWVCSPRHCLTASSPILPARTVPTNLDNPGPPL